METNCKSVHLNKEYDSEYRMKDVFFHMLYRWRSILLVTLLCAAVIGSWQAFSVNAVHQAGDRTKDELRYEQDMEVYQKDVENTRAKLNEYRDLLEERTAYRKGSLLMQLDPEKVWMAEKKYLAADLTQSAADILAVYTGAMITDHDEAALEEAFGTSNAGYAGEVVTINANSEENAFRVTVAAATKEMAEKGMAYVARKIGEAEKNAQNIKQHTLMTVNEGVSLQILPDLTGKKLEVDDSIAKYKDKVKTLERNLTGTVANKPLQPGDPVTRGILTGAGLGLLAMIAVYLIALVWCGKLKRGDEISEQYGVPLFGEINRSGARKPGKGFDGLLEKLESGKKTKTEEQVYENAAALVQKNMDEDTLILAGTVGEDVLVRVREEMKKQIAGDINIGVLPEFPAGNGALEEVCKAAVLWVEEKNVSRRNKIRKAAEMLETTRAKVIGVLVV